MGQIDGGKEKGLELRYRKEVHNYKYGRCFYEVAFSVKGKCKSKAQEQAGFARAGLGKTYQVRTGLYGRDYAENLDIAYFSSMEISALLDTLPFVSKGSLSSSMIFSGTIYDGRYSFIYLFIAGISLVLPLTNPVI